MRGRFGVVGLVLLLAACGSDNDSGSGDLDAQLRLNQIQVRGTHNSYHIEPRFPFHPSHRYTHAPLPVQFSDQGVRAIELDVHWSTLRQRIEVYHILGIDQRTTCQALSECLTQVRDWSDAHPQHLPIFIWVEVKDELGAIDTLSSPVLVDDVLREALGDRLLTPDELQGDYSSVREALDQQGWPTLARARGRVLAMLLNRDDVHAETYTHGYTHLNGRAMFASGSPAQFSQPWVAVAKIDNPASPTIAEALALKILTASNICAADASDEACRERLDAALASGTNMLCDDLPAPVAGRDYVLALPNDAVAVCNPVSGVGVCATGTAIAGP